MNTKELKFNIFLNAALTKKGYKLEELIQLSDQELDALPISTALITGIKETRDNNFITDPVTLEKELKDQLTNNNEHAPASPDILNEYKDVPHVTELKSDEVESEKPNELEVGDTVKPVEVVRVVASTSVLNKVKEALLEKDAKAVSAYTKHLKTVLTEEELSTLDPAVISDMINARIAEVKSK